MSVRCAVLKLGALLSRNARERENSGIARHCSACDQFLVYTEQRPRTAKCPTRAICWMASKQKMRSLARHNANNFVSSRHIRHLDPCLRNNAELPRFWRPFEDPRIRYRQLCLCSGRIGECLHAATKWGIHLPT